MGSVRDNDTRVIARRLALLLVAFYVVYYVLGSIIMLSMRVRYRGDVPFDHIAFGVRSRRELAPFLSLITTYAATVGLMLKIVKSSSNAWDYALTLSTVHWIVSCVVMRAFPTNWVWWLTFGLATLALTVCSELVNYFCYDLRHAAKIADQINA